MKTRKASIKETGEELSPEKWARFDAAVAEVKAMRQAEAWFDYRTALAEPERSVRVETPDR